MTKPRSHPVFRFVHRPPTDVAPDTNTEDQITRINELSRTARATWLSLLGYLAFVGVTLLGVEDIDFFDPSRQTELPLIGVSIPTASFFAFAPILGAALYIYLHLYLLKLWEELATVEPTHKDAPISDHLTPWLINDLGLSLRKDQALKKRPLGRLSKWVTITLVFLAGPLTLTGFWVRSFPALNEWLTLFIALLVYLTLRSGLISWRYLHGLIVSPEYAKTQRHNLLTWRMTAPIALAFASVTWLATEGDFDHYTGYKITGLQPFASANLAGKHLSERPTNWRNSKTAQRRFRATWCKRQNIPLDTCGQIYNAGTTPPKNLAALRKNWCAKKFLTNQCTPFFANLDTRFLSEWKEERSSLMIGTKTANLESRDLRGATLENAFLVQANLKYARLKGANLTGAQLEGANLTRAQLEGANLWRAQLEGADLWQAQLEGADLRRAQLEGADLWQAQLEGANLWQADMRNVDWASTTNNFGLAQSTDFRGARNLTQDQFQTVLGDTNTLLPLAQDGNPALHVWTCWAPQNLPDTIDQIFERFVPTGLETTEEFRRLYICPKGTKPQPTGTPWPLDKPRPEGHPLGPD